MKKLKNEKSQMSKNEMAKLLSGEMKAIKGGRTSSVAPPCHHCKSTCTSGT